MNKEELQYQIKRRAKQDTALTDHWLKNRGMTPESLIQSKMLLLQAQKTAHELIGLPAEFVSKQKRDWLQDFAHRSSGKRLRLRITDKECYGVLNFAKQVNRKLFKQARVEQA